MDSLITYCARIFQVLGQETRARIIETLAKGEMSVVGVRREIAKPKELKQSNASRHLSIIKDSGLVACRKEKKLALYRIKHAAVLPLLRAAKDRQLIAAIDKSLKKAQEEKQKDGAETTEAVKKKGAFDFTDVLAFLGEPNRLRIIEALRGGPVYYGDLLAKLVIEQPLLSHHLEAMRSFLLVGCRTEGGRSVYHLENERYFLDLVDAATNIVALETLNRQSLLLKESGAGADELNVAGGQS